MSVLLNELASRWRSMFERLASGEDFPPGQRLRLEGMMESAVLCGLSTEAELVAAMDAAYRDAFASSLADDLGADWQTFHPFPEIPAFQRRAPVYPSTRD